VIKYLGSKRLLIPSILETIKTVPNIRTVSDVFSGTSRVGHALKKSKFRVLSNDYCEFASTLARCYVEADDILTSDVEKLIKELNGVQGSAGYFTETFCVKSHFFQAKNGERVDAIREEIEKKSLDEPLKSVLLTSLMEAADRVDSTCGIQMAYVKSWSKRSYNPLELRVPHLLQQSPHGPSKAYCMDANTFVKSHEFQEVDAVYLDPPYNQHSYLGNYHIWETLVKWDKPEHYGKACKRAECKVKKSKFNSKKGYFETFKDLISNINAKLIVVSFNNEGYLKPEQIVDVLRTKGTVCIRQTPYKRYVGAQLGQHNPLGERVSEISHLKNIEYTFYVSDDSDVVSALNQSS